MNVHCLGVQGPATKSSLGVVKSFERRTFKINCRASLSLLNSCKLIPFKTNKSPGPLKQGHKQLQLFRESGGGGSGGGGGDTKASTDVLGSFGLLGVRASGAEWRARYLPGHLCVVGPAPNHQTHAISRRIAACAA